MSHLLSCTVPPAYCLGAYHALPAVCELFDEADSDYTVLLFDDSDQLCACGSLRGNVLKQIAVHPRAEQNGYCAEIVTDLVRTAFEHASSQCDFVLVFVLSENVSLFPAVDRYALVRAGIADLHNVFVAQSGDYLVSRATFPTYFLKDNADHNQARCDLDLYLFAKRIAPALNICVRFVGQEPFDTVTRYYNGRMKQILPPLGIQVVEIPRWQNVSASQVRKLLQEGRVQETASLLPATTYEYCKRHFG